MNNAAPSQPEPTSTAPACAAAGFAEPPLSTTLQPAITIGFTCSVATWAAWIVLASPWVKVPPTGVALGVIGVWMLAAGWCGRFLADRSWIHAAITGIVAGLVSSGINLLALGSELMNAPDPTDITQGQGVAHPDALWTVLGFFVAGALIGGVGCLVGSLGTRAAPAGARGWFARQANVSAIATLPLLLLGGMVTSTESGLSVTGWPDTFGANMFLYPISLMSQPRVFMEHSHRLLGAMVGLTILMQWIVSIFAVRRGTIESIVGVVLAIGAIALAMMTGGAPAMGMAAAALSVLTIIWAVIAILRLQLTAGAGALLVLVIAQGVIGGTRVTESSSLLAIVHGVTGQLLVALAGAFALCASSRYENASPITKSPLRMSIILACAMFLQIVFGAAYRHLRRGDSPGASHALMAHIALSLVVLVVASITGSMLAGRKDSRADRPRCAVRVGKGLSHVVGLQFLLGWAAFGIIHMSDARGGIPTADQLGSAPSVPIGEALIATAHQANGALLGVLIAMTLAWAWRLRPGRA